MYKGKSMKLGGGGRFQKMMDAMMKKGMSSASAKNIAAAAGRKKYGNEKMNKMAQAGKKRAKRGRK